MQEQDTVTSSEFRRFREEMLGLIMGNNSKLSNQAYLTVVGLTEADKAVLQRQTRNQLLCPSRLNDAWTNLNRGQQTLASCKCLPRHQINKTLSWWGLRFRSERRAQHEADCPYRLYGCREWKYSLAATLYPFLKTSVELTLGVTRGAGAWSMVTPLRFYRMAKRRPLFSAFLTTSLKPAAPT